jgi:arylsulfatase A-like enzyme
LDRLAAKGVRFTQAITGGSWTQAAFPVLLTSSYASMYGGCLGPLAPERPSPVETLASQDYATAGFSTSPLLSRTYGYQRGFRQFFDLVPHESDPTLRHIKGGHRLLRSQATHYVSSLMNKRTRPSRIYVSAAELTESVCRWLDDVDKPFFGWVHYMDVHWPYHREEALTHPRDIAQAWRDLAHYHDANWNGGTITGAQRTHYVNLYEQALQYTDSQVGRLLDHLDITGLAADTIVVVVSDHGEELLDHGRWGHFENNFYDEILRVPFIIHLPSCKAERTIDCQVRTLDIMPTILDLCDCSPPEGMEGASLLPLWARPDEAGYEGGVSISETLRDSWHIIAIRTEFFKYIWDKRRADRPLLFDLQADPGEKHDVSSQYPDRVKELQAYVDEHLRRAKQTMPDNIAAAPTPDEEVIARLRDLGYVE